MSQAKSLQVRAYLIHMTHYDPLWFDRKESERSFDLEVGCDMVKAMAENGFNMLIIDLADGVEYRSMPELKRHYTVPRPVLEKLIACARENGLEVVPKLNFSKGPKPRHDHNYWFRPHNTPADDETYWKKAFELIDEVIEVTKPERYFFIGMDEDFLRTPDEYVAAVNTLHEGLTKRKLTTVMWNDTPHLSGAMLECVEKTLAAEENISKDVVQVPWDYQPLRAVSAECIAGIRAKGFEVWIAPGRQPDEVAKWKQFVLQNDCSGMVMTAWRPVTRRARDSFLELINELGPIYSREEEVQTEPVVELPPPPARNITRAEMKPPTDSTLEPTLALNRLGKPLETVPHLLPPTVYVRNWMLLGPFPFDQEKYHGKLSRAVNDDDSFLDGNEAGLVAEVEGTEAHGVTWRGFVPAPNDRFTQIVDLARTYDNTEYALAYGVAHVFSEKARSDCSIYAGSDDYVKVWVNGELIHGWAKGSRGIGQDDDKIEGVVLCKGWNRIVVKCVNLQTGWGFILRVADENDKPLLTD